MKQAIVVKKITNREDFWDEPDFWKVSTRGYMGAFWNKKDALLMVTKLLKPRKRDRRRI